MKIQENRGWCGVNDCSPIMAGLESLEMGWKRGTCQHRKEKKKRKEQLEGRGRTFWAKAATRMSPLIEASSISSVNSPLYLLVFLTEELGRKGCSE